MNIDNYARVRCPVHGPVVLNLEEYERQINDPDSTWLCPAWEVDPPGQCGREADFDDEFFETQGGGRIS